MKKGYLKLKGLHVIDKPMEVEIKLAQNDKERVIKEILNEECFIIDSQEFKLTITFYKDKNEKIL